MKVYKKIILGIIALINLVIYTIGFLYLKVAIQTPTQLAGREIHFMGSYLFVILYLIVGVALTCILIGLLCKWKKT